MQRKYDIWVTITTTYRLKKPRLAENTDAAEKAETIRLKRHKGIPTDYVLDSEYIDITAGIASDSPWPVPQATKSRGR